MRRWIVCMLVMSCVWGLIACGRNGMEEEEIQSKIAGRTFIYEKDGFGGDFTIRISEDGTFEYYEGFLSSYIGMGDWRLDGSILILTDDEKMEKPRVNYFKVDGDDLVFLAEDSSNFLYLEVADGERFIIEPEEE